MNIPLHEIYVGMLVFTRIGALLFFMPIFSGKTLPVIVRLGLAFLIAYILYPFIPNDGTVPAHFLQLLIAEFNEVVVGMMMGFSVQIFFFTIEFAGHILSTEAGLAMSADMNPITDSNASTLGNIFFYFGVLLFFMTSVYQDVISAFFHSFQIIPPGDGLARGYANETLIRETAQVFVIGIRMAAPVIAINFIINITFAFLGKVVPKMNVFMISFAVRILVGLIIIVGSMELITGYMMEQIKDRPRYMLEFLVP